MPSVDRDATRFPSARTCSRRLKPKLAEWKKKKKSSEASR
jgi:hypothetical protein